MTDVQARLPEGWVPDDAVVFGVAHHLADDHVWEVTLPAYTLVGRGATLDEALNQASELLLDFFAICADDGLTFEESERRVPKRWLASILLNAGASSLSRRIRHSRVQTRLLRLPTRHAVC